MRDRIRRTIAIKDISGGHRGRSSSEIIFAQLRAGATIEAAAGAANVTLARAQLLVDHLVRANVALDAGQTCGSTSGCLPPDQRSEAQRVRCASCPLY